MNLDNFNHSDSKSKDKNISNSFFKIINEMILNSNNNKNSYEILSFFQSNIDLFFKIIIIIEKTEK